jgi:hypothetical protein
VHKTYYLLVKVTPDVTPAHYYPACQLIPSFSQFEEGSMKFTSVILWFCLVYCAASFSQDRGVIQCESGSVDHVPAWTSPGSAYVVEQLSCGQMVSIAGLDHGFVKIQIAERTGYVDAKYVRLLQSQSDQDRRIADLETQVKSTKQQPEPAHSESRPPAGIGQSNNYELQEYPKFEIFGGYNFVRLDGGAGNMDGWNASVAGNLNSVFGIKGEVSGIYGKDRGYSGLRYSGYSAMAGPQLTGRSGPASAFVHALFGVEHVGGGVNIEGIHVGASTNAFAMALGGGVDWHRGSWGIRLPQVDYFPWRALGGTAHNFRISGGILFRLN